MPRKTDQERLEELQENIRKQKALEKALRARISESERKARTRRLIELGAIVENALGITFDTPEKRERLKTYLSLKYQGGTVATVIANYVNENVKKSI